MSSTPSRSNLIVWSQPFGAFSPATNDALTLENRNRVFVGARLVRIIPGGRLNTSVISKGWIADHWQWHPSDSEQLRSAPRTSPAFGGTVDPSTEAYR